jgi:hypothetical protein
LAQSNTGIHEVSLSITSIPVACWIKALELILLDCLSRLKLTPVRENDKLDSRLIPSVALLLDGCERLINRQSMITTKIMVGKQHQTIKNNLIARMTNKILN